MSPYNTEFIDILLENLPSEIEKDFFDENIDEKYVETIKMCKELLLIDPDIREEIFGNV